MECEFINSSTIVRCRSRSVARVASNPIARPSRKKSGSLKSPASSLPCPPSSHARARSRCVTLTSGVNPSFLARLLKSLALGIWHEAISKPLILATEKRRGKRSPSGGDNSVIGNLDAIAAAFFLLFSHRPTGCLAGSVVAKPCAARRSRNPAPSGTSCKSTTSGLTCRIAAMISACFAGRMPLAP